jgi:monothiol glutaredoxin
MSDTAAKIKGIVDSADVVLFMKGVPQAPQCGFSMQVVQILNQVGAPYTAINVLADGDVREGIKAFSNWPTIPQLYVKGEFVGGCDITREMYQSGELTALLQKEGVALGQTVKA